MRTAPAAGAPAGLPRLGEGASPGGVRDVDPPRLQNRSPAPARILPQAKLAEEAERYDDMVQNVKALAELNQALNVEVRISPVRRGARVHLRALPLNPTAPRTRLTASSRCTGA